MKNNDEVRDIVDKLTLDEKIGMIHGAAFFRTEGVARLGIPPLVMSDGTMGVRQEFKPGTWKPAKHSEDAATYLPCGSALASTWNRSLAFKAGSVLGEEARGRGKDIILSPGINIKRSPLCGRNFEYLSEDPYLTGEIAAPYIRGIQEWDVAACVKHFAANNQETERLWVDVRVDEKVLREIYLPAFYDAVKKGGAACVMAAYNRLYGRHCSMNHYLLNDILREEWGFGGLVISDWGGVHDTVKTAEGELDIEMSVTNDFDNYFFADQLKIAVREGKVSEKAIDSKVGRILALMMQLHMLGGQRKKGCYNTQEHRETALAIARESVVLLKNENSRLPLHPEKIHRLLLIGENADLKHADGGGSAEIKALYEITPWMGISSLLGGNTEITYAQGYFREVKKSDSDADWQEKSLENGGGRVSRGEKESKIMERKREKLRREAIAQAKDADAVIFVGGLNHDIDSEGKDRQDMRLPYAQEELIRELLEARPDTVLVFIAGSPVEMNSFIQKADAIVWSYYNGMEGGTALAEVLFGKTNPSGKLAETFFKHLSDCPAHALGEFPGGTAVEYKEGRHVGYRFSERFDVAPAFSFGSGLSYTSFSIEDALYNPSAGTVRCTVRNTGLSGGKETVQVYRRIRDEGGFCRELAGFEKVEVPAGENRAVKIVLREIEEEDQELYIGDSLLTSVKI
ncbi:MAG TPA: glycoside hydrolase family 3 C-terminal domain-containing protein [Lachnospiraceae bacterium]|nr:glycoside hydrolase family 3 C-terminal domain-containing protein [Lachnospiraceae bacterium]